MAIVVAWLRPKRETSNYHSFGSIFFNESSLSGDGLDYTFRFSYFTIWYSFTKSFAIKGKCSRLVSLNKYFLYFPSLLLEEHHVDHDDGRLHNLFCLITLRVWQW